MGTYISYGLNQNINFYHHHGFFLFIGPNKLPWHFHHLRQTEGTTKQELSVGLATCAHLVLPGTSKRIVNGLISKRTRHHAKLNSDLSSRHKR